MTQTRKKLILAAVGIAVLAGGLAWLMLERRRAAETAARDQLKKLGAIVQLDGQQKHVSTVIVRDNLESALPLVADLHYLSHLDVADTAFSDDHVRHLRGLSRLKSLVLSKTDITDAALTPLAGMSIESLFLAHTDISAAALDLVVKMPALQTLDVAHTRVQDNVTALASAGQLEWLVLTGVDLSEAGEAELRTFLEMPKLRRLTMRQTQIDDDLVGRLKRERPEMMVEAQEDSGSPTPAAEEGESSDKPS